MILHRPAFSPRSCYMLRDQAEVDYFASRGGAPEAGLITWARSLIGDTEVFVDVGAHVGSWAQDLAQRCVLVLAFEPQRATYKRLEQGLGHAGFLTGTGGDEGIGRVIPIRAALGRQRGPINLSIVSVDGGGSTTRHRPELGAVLDTEECLMLALDEQHVPPAVGDYRIGLIKLDVEGNEADVIEGARSTIAAHRPHILAEAWLHPWYATERAALWALLESLDYTVQPVSGWEEMLWARPKERT